MQDLIEDHIRTVEQFEAQNLEQVEHFRIQYLGRKGILVDLFETFKTVANTQKKATGLLINQLKQSVETKHSTLKNQLEQTQTRHTDQPQDLSLQTQTDAVGHRHPLSLVRGEIVGIFERLGFNLSEGNEIVSDWENFGALNFPENHPARDMQDTFFVEGTQKMLLRTHTSNEQVAEMQKGKLPLRVITPGRVYRNETVSARSHCFFHQIEGLAVGKGISFVDLKQTLYSFAKELFGQSVTIRFRPSYFPFTEPSAEMDISCSICKGKGCNVCKHSGWVEILGCGMVDVNVLENCEIDPSIYTGFAFGMGIERIAMLKYGIKDLRLFSENDVRFLEQF